MKKLRITIEGQPYEVTVEVLDQTGTPSPNPVSAAPVSSAAVVTPAVSAVSTAQTVSGPGIVGSPLAGRVVSMETQPGQAVAKGDQLLVIEAMKMNTYIYAPVDGQVAEVFVKAGDAVEEGQALVRMA